MGHDAESKTVKNKSSEPKAIIKFIGGFPKYFFLGLIRFPGLVGQMLFYSLLGIKNMFTIKKTPSDNTTDKLLIEAKKNEQITTQSQERLRTKIQKKEAENIDSDKLLDEEKPKKDSPLKSILGFLNQDLGSKKQKEIKLPELKIDLNGPDAVKSKTKQTYKYLAKDAEGNVLSGYFNAFSKVEVYSFLVSEGNTVYKIETNSFINMFHGTSGKSSGKYKTKDLIFLLDQLYAFLNVGISLSDAFKILVKQEKRPKYQKILKAIVYDLSVGLSFSESLEKLGDTFPSILINMVKTAEMTGELAETLNDMREYFAEIEETRKAMITAMMYPAIIFVIAMGVGTFIMLYVVPKFVDIYNSMDTVSIPTITKMVLGLSEFLKKYIIYIGILFIIILFLFIYLYKNVKFFRRVIQTIIMRLPVFGKVVIYNEVTTFTKTFASLLTHNVFITDSMEILNKITNNEIYRELIYNAITNIGKGKSISRAFKDHWAFPVPAYEMIVTGEKTGQLPEMMTRVSVYYQDQHKNSVTRIKTFVEPALIIMLTAMVGVIVLSIVVPMFSMYSSIQA